MTTGKETDMGEANQRGTFEERREEAVWRDADVIVFLRAEDKNLAIGLMPQIEDQDNPAMVFAAFINANFPELVRMAKAAHERSKTAIPVPMRQERPAIVTEVTPRLVGADGPVAGEVQILGPDGRRVQ